MVCLIIPIPEPSPYQHPGPRGSKWKRRPAAYLPTSTRTTSLRTRPSPHKPSPLPTTPPFVNPVNPVHPVNLVNPVNPVNPPYPPYPSPRPPPSLQDHSDKSCSRTLRTIRSPFTAPPSSELPTPTHARLHPPHFRFQISPHWRLNATDDSEPIPTHSNLGMQVPLISHVVSRTIAIRWVKLRDAVLVGCRHRFRRTYRPSTAGWEAQIQRRTSPAVGCADLFAPLWLGVGCMSVILGA